MINYKRYDIDINSDWENQIKNQIREGGFYVDRFMKEILVENYEHIDMMYPELMIVSNEKNVSYKLGAIGFCP